MNLTEQRRALRGMLADPDEVTSADIDGVVWVTDRFALINTRAAGLTRAVDGAPPGWWRARSSASPVAADVVHPAPDEYAMRKLVDAFTNPNRAWTRLTDTGWAVVTERYDTVNHDRVLIRECDGRAAMVRSETLASWRRALTGHGEIVVEQVVDGEGMWSRYAIRVSGGTGVFGYLGGTCTTVPPAPPVGVAS